ncbi:hypothetical protein L7F22_044828 [Adiantum nelumboides]|nr:hypothetical protein [Adiantum nelumboides]
MFLSPLVAQRRTGKYPGQGGGTGMSYIYYLNSCPRTYDIVRERMQFYISEDPSQAAGILRLFFYDCFVQGCDASILLERPEGSERSASLYLKSLRATSLRIIDEIKASLEVTCPGVVSCADTLALAARDAIFMVGGPWIPILTGRKDSVVAALNQTVTASIPPPTLGFSKLKRMFVSKGLSVKDLVALSGAHNIGQAHCGVVVLQLRPIVSEDLDPAFGANLSQICLARRNAVTSKSHLTVHLDSLTPTTFDNAFFKNVLNKQAIFHSDAALLDDEESLSYVRSFALNQAHFFKQFHLSFLKMSQMGVLTNGEGEVRMSCTMPN